MGKRLRLDKRVRGFGISGLTTKGAQVPLPSLYCALQEGSAPLEAGLEERGNSSAKRRKGRCDHRQNAPCPLSCGAQAIFRARGHSAGPRAAFTGSNH